MSWSCFMLLVSEAVFKAALCVRFLTVTLVIQTRLGSLSYDHDDDWEENIKKINRFCLAK